jgi:hypothetical protein
MEGQVCSVYPAHHLAGEVHEFLHGLIPIEQFADALGLAVDILH